jgi:hypothetical protein
MITNYIRKANTEYEIYFLLTAYIQTVRFCDKLEHMPKHMAALPLTGRDNLQARFDRLIVELDIASKRSDDKACVIIKEALAVLSTALNCLWSLDNKRRCPQAGVDRQAAITWSAVPMTESAPPAVGQNAASKAVQQDLPPAPELRM